MNNIVASIEDLSPKMQDYLEAISILKKQNERVRSVDLSTLLKVKRPSVTEALGVLSQKGLVVHERYGGVELTKQGAALAESVYQRHKTLTRFICEILGVDSKIASEDACKMEHAMSPKTFGRFYKLIEFMDKKSKNQEPQWLTHFKTYCKKGKVISCTKKR
ncbi:MAG: metal-dependent transcriptional regulator [Candidatus Aceula meridiana]|nr:metal-dependent transcriptional regulator [Candidatus Aceula meridiana]